MSINHCLYNKFCVISTMECYSATRQNKLLMYTTMWLNVSSTMLSERSKHKRLHGLWLYLYDILEKINYTDRSRSVVSQGLDWERVDDKAV